MSEENLESSETSPDLSPLHAVLPCDSTVVNEDPSKRPVELGRPTRISVSKGKSGLGLKVIGGSDTNLVSIYDNTVYDTDYYFKTYFFHFSADLLMLLSSSSFYCCNMKMLVNDTFARKCLVFVYYSYFADKHVPRSARCWQLIFSCWCVGFRKPSWSMRYMRTVQ